MAPAQRDQARADRALIAELRRDLGAWLQRRDALDARLRAAHGSDFQQLEVVTAGGTTAPDPDGDDLRLDLDLEEATEGRDQEVLGGDGRPIAAELLVEFRALCAERAAKHFRTERKGYQLGISLKPEKGATPSALQRRLQHANRAFDLYVTDHWAEPWTTATFATPCSDGQAIYVATANNAVARVALDGTVQWLVWEHREDRERGTYDASYNGAGIGTRFCSSPLLCDGKLVVNQNGELRVYDAATGEKLWSLWNPYQREGQFPWRPHPESISPACTVLPLPDGGRLAVFTDGGGNLYRLDDGAVVCREIARVTWCSPVFAGELFCWRSSGPLVKDARGVQRLRAVSRDEVVVESLWSMGQGGGGSGARCATDVVLDGRILLNNRAHEVLNGTAALLDPTLADDAMDTRNRSPIVAGRHQYCLGWDKAWVIDLAGGPTVVNERAFVEDRAAEDPDWALRWGWLGGMEHGSPCAQGNRLFVRSKGFLWCIGDPAEAF